MANVRIRDQGKLTLKDSDNSNEVSLQSPSTVAADQDFIVPNADGSANNIITTNASGTLSFVDINTLVASDIDWQTGSIKTGDFTAVAGKGYFVNTTSGAITATLPASPSAGDFVALKDYAATFATNNLTIGRNGSNIQGLAANSDLTTDRASVVLQYIDATKGWLYIVENNVGDLENVQYVTATGGTITTSGDFKIHTFNSSGTFTVSNAGNAAGSTTVDYLIVAGGGGGGGAGGPSNGTAGGGGAGGYRESFPNPATGGLPVSVQAYPITVGAGASGGGGNPNGASAAGGVGSTSTFSTITSAGGGGGAGTGGNPSPAGGSGGGGGPNTGPAPFNANPGAGNTPPVSPPQGNAGGTGSPPTHGGAGGGGAGGAGGNGPAGGGGTGGTSTINSSPVTRSTGGAGSPPSPNTGGANTGNGGGGGRGPSNNETGQSGGSGIVIIRYKYQN